MRNARERILPPYTRRVDDWQHLATKAVAVTLLLVFAVFMGFWLAVFGQLVVQLFGAMLGVMLLAVAWMAPDSDIDFRRQCSWLLVAFLAAQMLWPNYMALNIAGLPWITPARLLFAALVLLFLLQLAQSRPVRDQLAGTILHAGPASVFFGLLLLLQFLTIALSSRPANSAFSVVNYFVLLNVPMFIALWLFSDEKMLLRVFRTILVCSTIIFVLCLAEYHNGRPIWAPYIPSFLQSDPAILESVLNPTMRVGDGRYRLRGVFGITLYFGQMVVIVTPLIVHALATAQGARNRALAALLFILLIWVAWATNARTAFLGTILAVLLYAGLFALRRFLKPSHQSDIVGPFTLFAGLGFVVLLVIATLSSARMRMWTIGGRQHAGSDASRDGQWDRAIDALISNPFGHGAGNAPRLAGTLTPKDIWVIDSYWINLLLDYGVLGFIAFFGFFLTIAWTGIRMFLDSSDRTGQLCGVFGMSILVFLLTTYTISQDINFYLPLLFAAAIAAQAYARSLKAGEAAPLRQPAPLAASGVRLPGRGQPA